MLTIHKMKNRFYFILLVWYLTADPGVMSSILAQSHTFVEFDHGIINNFYGNSLSFEPQNKTKQTWSYLKFI